MIPEGAYMKILVPSMRRSWRTLWRLRPSERVIFVGRITEGHLTTNLNGQAIAAVQAHDALHDLRAK